MSIPITFSPDPRPWSTRSLMYQYRPFRGMVADVKNRLPFYLSDWSEGFKGRNAERVTGSTIRMYFLNLMPAIAYTLDMNQRTNGAYGLNESILASAIAALAFSIFSVQPLTIVGVTGLISLFNYTVFDIVGSQVDYLQFQAWVMMFVAASTGPSFVNSTHPYASIDGQLSCIGSSRFSILATTLDLLRI
jgi:hypothetical protein